MDDLNTTDELDTNSAPHMLCLVEEPRGGMGADERVSISMVAVTPSTGDVVWDEFEDGFMRSELEVMKTRPSRNILAYSPLSDTIGSC